MASGGEAEDADAFGVDVPLGGVGAGDAHGLLGVFEVGGVFREVFFVRDAVLGEDAGDSDGVKPGADFGAFEVVGEDAVASAREDDYGCSGVVLRGFVDGEGWVADVGEVGERLAFDEAVGGLGDVFWWAFDLVVERSVGPDGDGLLGWGCDGGEGEGEEEFSHGAMVAELGAVRK